MNARQQTKSNTGRNIAVFASAFHPHVGGVEQVVRQLARAQQEQGDRLEIFTNRWPKDLPAQEMLEGLPVHRYPFRVPERSWKQRGGHLLYGAQTRRQVLADVRAMNADVLHVQCVSSNAWYALHAQKTLGLPLVVTLHSELTMDAGGIFRHSVFAQNLMQTVLARADAITGCSAQTLRDAEAFCGQPFGDRARVIYNGVNVAEFACAAPFPHPRPYLLAMGRLVPQKGFDILIRAFAHAARSGLTADVDLLIAGDGPERNALEQCCADCQMADRVHFIGRVERAQAASLHKGCVLFVLPSRGDEGFPMVLLEAMAAGKAILATRTGGVPEAVTDGETGLLVPREDEAKLQAALVQLLTDTGLRQHCAGNASRRAQEFAWPALAAQYQAVYEQV